MNMVLAWVLLIVISMTMIGGERGVDESDFVGGGTRLLVAGVMTETPAEGVIPSGAYIIGVTVTETEIALTSESLTPSRFSAAVSDAKGAPVTITYEYQDEINSTTLVPVLKTVDGAERSLVGLSLTLVAPVEYGFFGAIGEGTRATIDLTKRVTIGIFTFFGDIVTGQADFSTVAGPVGIVGHVGDAAQAGIVQLLFFTALISINLAIINLLPIPALDGGRLVLVAVETVLRKPLSPVLAGRVNLIGFIFLIGIMVAVTVSDIWKLF
jgi:regulator of sigma E protease